MHLQLIKMANLLKATNVNGTKPEYIDRRGSKFYSLTRKIKCHLVLLVKDTREEREKRNDKCNEF